MPNAKRSRKYWTDITRLAEISDAIRVIDKSSISFYNFLHSSRREVQMTAMFIAGLFKTGFG
jgi:hypothetical protein